MLRNSQDQSPAGRIKANCTRSQTTWNLVLALTKLCDCDQIFAWLKKKVNGVSTKLFLKYSLKEFYHKYDDKYDKIYKLQQ